MNRAEFVRTLELIEPALATNNMVPIFQCFVFDGEGVSAYDDSIAVAGPTDFDVGGAVALHGNTLLGLLSNSKAEEVTFTQKGQEVKMTMGRSVSTLPFQSSENFIFEKPTDKWLSKIAFTPSLADALTICLETVSSDTTQAALLGITIQGDKMYSCNSDALTRVQLKQAGKGRVLLSTAFCTATLKLWSTLEMTKGSLQFSDNWAFADFGDWQVYGRILEVPDPIDFEALIKQNLKAKTAVQPLPDDFSEALARAQVLAEPESQKTVVTISKGKLHLLTETHMGEVKDDLPLKGHPDVIANVNAGHLQRAIQYCDQIAFYDNCTVLEKAPDVFQIVSNMS